MPVVTIPPRLHAFLNAGPEWNQRGYRQFIVLATVLVGKRCVSSDRGRLIWRLTKPATHAPEPLAQNGSHAAEARYPSQEAEPPRGVQGHEHGRQPRGHAWRRTAHGAGALDADSAGVETYAELRARAHRRGAPTAPVAVSTSAGGSRCEVRRLLGWRLAVLAR